MRKATIVILTLLIVSLAVPAMADGAATFKAKCAMCHGADGKAQTSMGKSLKIRDFTSADVKKQSDADLIAITTNGKGKMPAYKGKLTDDEIKGVVAFIRTLK